MRITSGLMAVWLVCVGFGAFAADETPQEQRLMSFEEIAGQLGHYTQLAQHRIDSEEMSLEALAAGVEHYNHLIRSGHGTVTYASPGAQQEVLTAIFTFEGRKMRSDILEGHEAGVVKVYNGDFALTLYKEALRAHQYDTEKPVVFKGDTNSVDLDLDPRSWYQIRGAYYLKWPVEFRLRQNWARIVGKETIDGNLCYVVDESKERSNPQLLWICPEKGFRVVKSYALTAIGGQRIVAHRCLRYQSYEQQDELIWFPVRVEYALLPIQPGADKLQAIQPLPSGGPNVYTVHPDFRLNDDVSSYFAGSFTPGTIIRDLGSKRNFRVEDILPTMVKR